MAWLTGKVQLFENKNKKKSLEVGNPFAYKKDGKWFCIKTNQELKVKKVKINLKDH